MPSISAILTQRTDLESSTSSNSRRSSSADQLPRLCVSFVGCVAGCDPARVLVGLESPLAAAIIYLFLND